MVAPVVASQETQTVPAETGQAMVVPAAGLQETQTVPAEIGFEELELADLFGDSVETPGA